MWKQFIVFFTVLQLASSALAAPELVPDMAASHFETTRDEAGVTTCAVRTFAWVEVGDTTRRYDVTALTNVKMFGVVRLTTSEIATRSIDDDKVSFVEKTPAPTSFAWGPDTGNTTAPLANEHTKQGGAYIFPNISAVASIMIAVANGKPMKLAYSYPGASEDIVVRVTAPLKEEELSALRNCYDDLLIRLSDGYAKRFGTRPPR